jgi:hypothetical protein
MFPHHSPEDEFFSFVEEMARMELVLNMLPEVQSADPPSETDISGSWNGLALDKLPCSNVRAPDEEGCKREGIQRCSKVYLLAHCPAY